MLGGARSGKSSLALRIASGWGCPVRFIATAEAKDAEMASRINSHRASRPETWETIEAPRDLLGALKSTDPDVAVVLDCVSFWVANLVMDGVAPEQIDADSLSAAALAADRPGRAIVVSNEVGLGLVPDNELGRGFRDVLGRVNSAWVKRSEETFLVVAGRVLPLKELGVDDG